MKNKKHGNSDLQKLATLRDELKLQFHLFSAEAKQSWEQLEKDWQLISSEAENLKPVANHAAARATAATRPLMAKIENSLIQIREGIQRHHTRVG